MIVGESAWGGMSMSGTAWEPGRLMNTQQDPGSPQHELAEASHTPNEFYDQREALADELDEQGTPAEQLQRALAQVRQTLGEAREAQGGQPVVGRLIAAVERLLTLVEATVVQDQSGAPDASVDTTLEE